MENQSLVGKKVFYDWDKSVYEVINETVYGSIVIRDVKHGYVLKVFPEQVTVISNM
jgi:hypothetical protein